MRIRTLEQLAGANTAASEINDALASGNYQRFRFLVAFARWSGLNLLDAELQSFATRRGTAIEGAVGVDLGGTTVEALTYLAGLPSATIKVFRSGNPAMVFHPKVYIFEGATTWRAIVGSSNLSMGGLFSNAEASLIVDGDAGEPIPGFEYWDFIFNCRPPLLPEHAQVVTDALLDELAPKLDPYTKAPPDRARRRTASGVTPLPWRVAPPPVGRPPIPRKTAVPARKSPATGQPTTGGVTTPVGAGTLYMELWEETGGGTQVQLAKDAFTKYFGATSTTVTWVTLTLPSGGKERVRLQSFPNDTFRIPLAFVRTTSKPAVLKFERTGPDAYAVDVRSKGRAGYTAWLSKCNRQRNPTSKRYGIY